MSTTPRPGRRTPPRGPPLATTALAAASFAALAGAPMPPSPPSRPRSPAQRRDIGLDNDNADNPFVQPPGVSAPQHMDETDVLFGRATTTC